MNGQPMGHGAFLVPAVSKKLFSSTNSFVDDGLEGIVAATPHLRLIRESRIVYAAGASLVSPARANTHAPTGLALTAVFFGWGWRQIRSTFATPTSR